MRYFHRAHAAPEQALERAHSFFSAHGFRAEMGPGDHARFTSQLGIVDLHVEIEGGHYTRLNLATTAVGESDLDKRVKRFLSEFHRAEDPAYAVRGAY
jgi:hypothetical protein